MLTNNIQLAQLKDIILSLQETLAKTQLKNTVQLQIFHEYIQIFKKLAQKLASLSNRINEQILNAQDENQQSIGNIYQYLSNTLLRMSDCSKNVALKAKNQVFDPMKLFVDNYQTLNHQLLQKLKTRQSQFNQKYNELTKNRENYMQASEKLQKNRRLQGKSMAKIENGDLQQLEKFNNNIKKMTENIKANQQQYVNTVNQINNNYKFLRNDLKQVLKSLSYNEQSRLSFSRKSLVSSIKVLEDFKSCYDSGIEKKIEDYLKKFEQQKPESVLKKNLSTRISLLASSKFKQQYITFEDLIKQRKKKSIQEQNSYLNQIFIKVKQQDKEAINAFIKPWFQTAILKKSSNQESPLKVKTLSLEQVNNCRESILSNVATSFYFIQTVYQQVIDMSSFYCKLSDDDFLSLLGMFNSITSGLDIQQNTPFSNLATQFVYKMIQVSMRIMWKKNTKSNRGQPIQLLCQHFGTKCKKLSNQINLKKIFLFIQKKKIQKKTSIQNQHQSKSMMNSFVKGVTAVMKGKKQLTLTDDEYFSCLTQITQIMANLLVPSEISFPFVKSLLGRGENVRSFQYLKSILLQKKDIQERQKIFYQTEIKGKKQQKMNKILQSKKLASYCIRLTAKRGFFDKKDLGLRLLCTQLRNVHQQILCHLNIKTQQWVHLIPLDQKLNYLSMKQEVAQNSVPSAVEQIITLDVNRSLHNHGQVLNPTVLHSLLRIYAYFHKDISYCQGMNYIAGYLYIKTKDQQAAYRIFQYLMQVRFKQLFANQFEVLKLKMYQFERLLGIFHPEVSDHFKKQSISPECYIVSWIITLFASSYQYTMESYLIDVLWERFIIWGWRQFFRFVLALFNMFKEELVELTYDKALHFLGEMGRSQMFLAGKEYFKKKFAQNKIQQYMDQYPIEEELLQNLKKQYKLN